METDRQTVETDCPQPPMATLSTSGSPMPAHVLVYCLWTVCGGEKKERKKNLSFHLGQWGMENPHSKLQLGREIAQPDKWNVIRSPDESIHQQRCDSASHWHTSLCGKTRGMEETDMKNSGFSMVLKWWQHADIRLQHWPHHWLLATTST